MRSLRCNSDSFARDMAAALPAVAPIRSRSLVRRRKSSNSPESRARERVKELIEQRPPNRY
ncbi:hypothetical protein BMA10247_A1303 [Burkholderia mallei NCTC 10247]|nr:hypothetical protein BMA10247_A1303 [Burkholderia mallei NCTC 10247]EDS82986.1 hypothetical protein BURPSS13_K0254 [Burkholderia pseudomallei S13]